MSEKNERIPTISEFFQQDHREIDELLRVLKRDLETASESQDPAIDSLVAQFGVFDSRLDRHIRWEEETLFPAVEEQEPQLRQGPGEVMRMEHVEIRDLKKTTLDLLAGGEISKALRALENMVDVLGAHNQKEEKVYYPMADKLLSADTIIRISDTVRADS